MPVASLTIGPASCPGKCNGHGMCNSKGHCHCDIGYAPPYCDVPGPGGSIDSGPASDSEATSSNWFILLYIVLLLVPIMAIIFLLSQKVRRGDWRLLVEKAKPRKRLSEVDPMATASVAEAAAALPGGKSGASSPTQALLPHVDTSTSALSTVLSEKVQGEAPSPSNKSPRSGSLFASLKKPHFMQNLAKSISLPSPKLRAAMKNMATYEIKVEHQVPKDDISSPSEEIVTEAAEVKTSKDSVLFIKEEKVNVQTTTVEQPPLTASKSLTTFGSRPVRSTLPMSSSFRSSTGATSSSSTTTTSFESQLPTSTMASIAAIAQSKVLEKVKALEADQKPKEPSTTISLPTTESVVASIVVSSTTSASSVSSTVTASKVTTTTSTLYSQDPKLAFPHSSSFAGRASSAFTSSSSSASTKVGSSQSANSLRLTTSATTSADVVKKKNGSNKEAVVEIKQPLLHNKPPPPPPKPTSFKSSHLKDEVKSQTASEAVVAAVDKVKTPSPTKTTTGTTTPSTSVTAATPSPTTTTMPLLSKTSTLPMGEASSSLKKSMGISKSSTLPLVPSRPVISKPVLQTATPDAASLISKSHSTGVSQTSIIKGEKIACNESSSKETKESKRASRGVVFCDPLTLPSPTNPNNPPIIHIQPKISTTPQEETTPIPKSKPNPPPKSVKSVTSPVTPVVTKPIEAKAVIVSSVITPTWSTEPKAVTSNAVLCHIDDTDSGSEAGSPKKDNGGAPMASPESDKVDGLGNSVPQKTKSLSKSLKSKLVKRSHSEKKEKAKTPTTTSSEDTSGLSSPTSSLRSNEPQLQPPPRPERGPISKLDISGPILQTNVEMKGNFLPVCRAADATPTETTAKNSFSTLTSTSTTSKMSSKETSPTTTKTQDLMSPVPVSTKASDLIRENAIVMSSQLIRENARVLNSNSGKISPKKNKAPQPPPIIPRRSSPSKTSSENTVPSKSETAAPKKTNIKRPASIATTRPSRPSAPPPRPPPQKPNVGGSPTRSDTSSLASVDSSVSSSTATSKGPSVTSEEESVKSSKKILSPLTSPLSLDDFDTPLSSPIIARRSPDALSTTSSSDGDLMREILKDLDTEVKDEVSTLMRKKKNKNKKIDN